MAEIFLIDTNAVSDLMSSVATVTQLVQEASIYIPVIVLGELYFAYENGSRKQENYERFALLSNHWKTLGVNESTAQTYARIQLQLHRKGQMIPLNDLWIAALALEHGLPLLTRDAHFKNIDGLKVVTWTL
jgi:tRNA(fMet)-specific endonuclease VapC